MNNLIKVDVNDRLEQVVSARELHEKLGIVKHFTQWWEYQSEKLGLIEGKDFLTIMLESTGGRPGLDYEVPLDIGKHLCMISGGEKAHQLREYFIQVERAWNSPEQVMARALQIAQNRIENLQFIVLQQVPKVEAFDTFMDAKNNQTMNVVAKSLGIGRNKLFDFLREQKVLMANNTPYQEHIDCGRFVVKEKPISMGESTINKPQTFVTPKGVAYIEKLLKEKLVLV